MPPCPFLTLLYSPAGRRGSVALRRKGDASPPQSRCLRAAIAPALRRNRIGPAPQPRRGSRQAMTRTPRHGAKKKEQDLDDLVPFLYYNVCVVILFTVVTVIGSAVGVLRPPRVLVDGTVGCHATARDKELAYWYRLKIVLLGEVVAAISH